MISLLPTASTARHALRLRALNVVRSVPFRVFVALACLAFHAGFFQALARERMGLPFNVSPGTPPAFEYPDQPAPAHWNRLLVSRWDSQHYIDILERGYSRCPPEDLRGAALNPYLLRCGFNFYPGYGVAGRLVKWVSGLPADYALLAVSLVASFWFLFLWTGPALTSSLGLAKTYLALLFFNVFTTGFTLVTIQTEPLTLVSALGAFVCMRQKRWLLGAAVAGMGGAMRVTGGSIGAAYGLALLAYAVLERGEKPLVRWGRVALAAPLCAWGQLAIFIYFGLKYKDPLLYVHAHSQSYSHSVSLIDTIWPSPAVAMRALTMGFHEGLFVLTSLLFLALGMRRALARFSTVEKVYWYALSALGLAVGLLGSAGLAYLGMNRYLLIVLPLFFAMAVVFRRRPVAIGIWSLFGLWHAWNVDLCVFLAQQQTPQYCPLSYVP
jgi:hypothetical protein